MAKNVTNGNGTAVQAAEKAVAEKRAALEALQGQHAALVAEKAEHEGKARQSLTGVALDRLRGVARDQAASKVKVEELAIMLAEVTRREGEARAELARAEQALGMAKVQEAQVVITEQEARAAALLRQAADLLADNARLANDAACRVPGERGKVAPELLLDGGAVGTLEMLLARYGETYATRHGKPSPVPWKLNTSGGWKPAPAYRR